MLPAYATTINGPLLGGFFVDNLSWRWIFYVNLPIGIVAFVVIGAVFHSRAEHVRHSIDYLGAALLAGGLSAVVLFTSLGGTTYAWRSGQIVRSSIDREQPPFSSPLRAAEGRHRADHALGTAPQPGVFAATSAVPASSSTMALLGAITYMPATCRSSGASSSTGSGPAADADDAGASW